MYLSNSVSLVESRNPFANGLLSIFSLVIYKNVKNENINTWIGKCLLILVLRITLFSKL